MQNSITRRLPAEPMSTASTSVATTEQGTSDGASVASGQSRARFSMRFVAASLVGLYLVVLVVAYLVVQFIGDSAWWTLPLVFGPRWVISVPLLFTLPWAVLSIRRRAMAAVGTVAVNLLLLGVEIPWTATNAVQSSTRLRIVSCNVQGGHADLTALSEFARKGSADVILLQENSAEAVQAVVWPGDWHRLGIHGIAVLSRFPIRAVEQTLPEGDGGAPLAMHVTLATPAGDLQISSVHLSTPRDALEAMLDHKWGGADSARENIARRDRESKLLSGAIAQSTLPVIVAGDFNLPVDSRIYRDHWGGRFGNAFSDAGWGLGYTKYTRRFGIRIDHVLSSSHWRTVECRVGPDIGSDHRPVFAELELLRP